MANLVDDELKLANDEMTALAADSARARCATLGYIAGESPGDVYRGALEEMTGRSACHIPVSQLRGLVDLGLQARRQGHAASPALAMDAAPADVSDFEARFGKSHHRVMG